MPVLDNHNRIIIRADLWRLVKDNYSNNQVSFCIQDLNTVALISTDDSILLSQKILVHVAKIDAHHLIIIPKEIRKYMNIDSFVNLYVLDGTLYITNPHNKN